MPGKFSRTRKKENIFYVPKYKKQVHKKQNPMKRARTTTGFVFRQKIKSKNQSSKHVVLGRSGITTKNFRFIITVILRGPIVSTELFKLSRVGSSVLINHGGHLISNPVTMTSGRWRKKKMWDVSELPLDLFMFPIENSLPTLRKLSSWVRFDFLFKVNSYFDIRMQSVEEELDRAQSIQKRVYEKMSILLDFLGDVKIIILSY